MNKVIAIAILGGALSTMLVIPLMATNSEKDYRDNVQWAKDSINNNQHKAGFTGFDVKSLCNDAACQQGVANPEQSRYYNDPSAMNSAKMQGMSTDGQAQSVTTGFNKGRPTIDENDPAYQTAVGYQSDAYNISHGISSKYHDCDKGLVCEVDSLPRSCTLPTNNPVQCYLTPFVKSTSTHETKHPFRLTGMPPFNLALPNSEASITRIDFTGDFKAFLGASTLEISINAAVIGRLSIQTNTQRCNAQGMCPSKVNGSLAYQGKASPLSVGIGTMVRNTGGIPLNVPVEDLQITFVITETQVDVGYNNSCGAMIPECQQVQSKCLEGKQTRVINGVSVTVDCWKEQITYQCAFPNTCAALADCSIQSTSCDTSLGGVCIKNKQHRLCETSKCRDTGLVCGEDSFSLSGDYYDPAATRNTDFNQAAAGLAAVSEAASDVKDKANINENSAIIFKGTVMECTDKPLGISNCCQNSGWGNGIGLTSCSEEEKALGTAKEDKLTVSLGRYCAEKVLGVCIRKKQSYCAFNSKLARIVQVGGRAQLGRTFGSAKSPDCSAFSPNDLQQIDMSSMDFSDFYEDMYDAIELPNTDEIQKRLQQSVGGTTP
jgi:conjugal transfer mating pair stabilization protein TraN